MMPRNKRGGMKIIKPAIFLIILLSACSGGDRKSENNKPSSGSSDYAMELCIKTCRPNAVKKIEVSWAGYLSVCECFDAKETE